MRALKKVPSNAKGLKKLPTPVRNKMGYMQDGAKFAPMSNQKISREMVEKDFNESMKKHMQFTNKLAKQLADGVDSRGLPLKPAARKALEKDVKKRKQYEQTAKPNYKDVGLGLPKGPAPFEDDAMPKAKYGMKAVKKKMPGGGKMPVYRKGGKVVKYQEGGVTRAGSGTVRTMPSSSGREVAYYDGPGGVPKEGMPGTRSFTTPGTDRKNKDVSKMEPLKLRDHLRVLEASKLLKQSGVNSVITMSDDEILKAARDKNLYDDVVNNSNKSYKNEIARRKLRK